MGIEDREKLLIRKMIAAYLQYRVAVAQKDGYMIRMYYGDMGIWKHALSREYGKTDKELQVVIARVEGIIMETIKNGQP